MMSHLNLSTVKGIMWCNDVSAEGSCGASHFALEDTPSTLHSKFNPDEYSKTRNACTVITPLSLTCFCEDNEVNKLMSLSVLEMWKYST